MANISSVYGTMTLNGDWTPDMVENLNILLADWRKWTYNIDSDGFEKDARSASFIANGRWAFDANLEQIGDWTNGTEDDKVKKAYEALCNSLKDKVDENGTPDASILVDFSEEEGGCGILRTAKGEIVLKDGDLTGMVTESVDYEYTKENLVKLDFYDCVEDINWLDDESEAGGADGFKIEIKSGRVRERKPNLYYYDFRHGDDWGTPCTMEKTVYVNHFGTLISTVSLDSLFDGTDYIPLDEAMRSVIYNHSDDGAFDGYELFPSFGGAAENTGIGESGAEM